MDPSILINWTSPFPVLGVSGVLFHFYSISNRYSCQQTVKTLIRRRVLRRLIWVCTVCLCPKNRTLGLYGLKQCVLEFRFNLLATEVLLMSTHNVCFNGELMVIVIKHHHYLFLCYNKLACKTGTRQILFMTFSRTRIHVLDDI